MNCNIANYSLYGNITAHQWRLNAKSECHHFITCSKLVRYEEDYPGEGNGSSLLYSPALPSQAVSPLWAYVFIIVSPAHSRCSLYGCWMDECLHGWLNNTYLEGDSAVRTSSYGSSFPACGNNLPFLWEECAYVLRKRSGFFFFFFFAGAWVEWGLCSMATTCFTEVSLSQLERSDTSRQQELQISQWESNRQLWGSSGWRAARNQVC